MASLFASLPLLSRVRSKSGSVCVRSTTEGPEALIFRREALSCPSSRQHFLSYLKDRDSIILRQTPAGLGIGDDEPVISVAETKCTTALFWKEKPMPEPPNLVVLFTDTRDYRNFLVAFTPKENGTISPKYYAYQPDILANVYEYIWCSCNGLLCLTDAKLCCALWNPTTGEYKILPKIFVEPQLECFCHTLGMWFDHRSEDYKLLHFVQTFFGWDRLREASYQIHLYSLQTNSWKRIPLPSTDEFDFYNICGERSSPCINGVYYCKASLKSNLDYFILAFDFTTETFSTLPLPGSCVEGFRLTEYKGLLCAYKICKVEDEDLYSTICGYELWIMRDGSWTKESIFHTDSIVELLRFSQDGNLVYFASNIGRGEIVVFNRSTRKLKSVGVYCPTFAEKMFPFVESFVQLNGITCIDSKRTWTNNVSLIETEFPISA